MLPGMHIDMSASGGVAPNTVDWSDISGGEGGTTEYETLSGFVGTITLRAEISGLTKLPTGAVLNFYASRDDGGNSSAIVEDGEYADITVTPGVRLLFSAGGTHTLAWTASYTVTVKYKSAGSPTFDQTLDTFAVSLSGDGSGGGE